MNPVLIFAIIFIVSAFIFYSIGIWSEKLTKHLKLWHVVLLWLGLLCDSTGTALMSVLAGKWSFNLHGITGALAILLMLGNAIWATYVYKTKDEKAQAFFTQFSIVVWLIWLIPFLGGMAGAMNK